MADIVISGYHGFSNSGDEALLLAILNSLRKRKPDIDVTVLSKTPDSTSAVYGVNSIYRYSFFKIKKEMKKSRMLLFGGGSLLQDVTSSKSLLYYLAVISLAQKCKVKTMLYANGIGPISKKLNRKIAARILNKVDIITLRDDMSDVELKNLGVTKPRIVITADPAFTLNSAVSLSGQYLTNMVGVPKGTKLCVISIRSWKKAEDAFVSKVASLCDYMADKYSIMPLFVPMQYPLDTEISAKVLSKMKNNAYIINRELTVPEMFSVLSEAEIVIGMRLHSLIYATTLEIPSLALVYDPKVSAFMESLGQPDVVNVEDFDLENAMEILSRIIEEREERKQRLRQTNSVLREAAEENTSYAIELLD